MLTLILWWRQQWQWYNAYSHGVYGSSDANGGGEITW